MVEAPKMNRTTAHHEAVAEALVDLATEHMHARDREVGRGWRRSRKRERWHRENTLMILGAAQVHATLAVAKS
jgi:hypothetical protein